MPYINITEQEIERTVDYTMVDNAVLIFGFDFHRYKDAATKLDFNYKLYLDIEQFLSDFREYGEPDTNLQGDLFRPFMTACDCLYNGLPVIWVPLDDYLGDEFVISGTFPATSEGSVITDSEDFSFIEYNWIDNPSFVVENNYWSGENPTNPTGKSISDDIIDADTKKAFVDLYKNSKFVSKLALKKLTSQVEDSEGKIYNFSDIIPLNDKINFPISFITTCGYEDSFTKLDGTEWDPITESSIPIDKVFDFQREILTNANRLDIVYLYDLDSRYAPQKVSKTLINKNWLDTVLAVKPETLGIIYPWGTYYSYYPYAVISRAHMPGSYGYLMAYANSIKNNKPWLAVAGVNRGRIPNIVDIDYKVSEPFMNSWQEARGEGLGAKINPIIDFGSTYGKLVFGNRTCFPGQETDTGTYFKDFLNIRLLLINIHKAAYQASIRHMFEPNDDIVWLSFKQKVNELLDQMVSGRGIKWYKWYKLQPDIIDSTTNRRKLGQIKARLVIRPIEAVESFNIDIYMTDQDIEITY